MHNRIQTTVAEPVKIKVWVKTSKLKSLVEKIVEVDELDYCGETGTTPVGDFLEEDMMREMLQMITWNYEVIK